MNTGEAVKEIVDGLMGKRAIDDDYYFVEGVIAKIGTGGLMSRGSGPKDGGIKPLKVTSSSTGGIILYRSGNAMGGSITLTVDDVRDLVDGLRDLGHLNKVAIKNRHVVDFLKDAIDGWEE